MGQGRWSGPRASNVHNPAIRENPDPRQIRYQRPMPAIDPGLRPPGYMIPPRFEARTLSGDSRLTTGASAGASLSASCGIIRLGRSRALMESREAVVVVVLRIGGQSRLLHPNPCLSRLRPAIVFSWAYASADRAASYIRSLVGAGSVRQSGDPRHPRRPGPALGAGFQPPPWTGPPCLLLRPTRRLRSASWQGRETLPQRFRRVLNAS
jgi:hypothetical protein